MRFKVFFLLFFGTIAHYVLADNSIEVTRGLYPFMAFLYYQDSEILEEKSNNRFFRSAVIIRPSWLLSAAIDPPQKDDKILGFPDKTLLARAGAILINTQISLNEDDYEQEREIMQLIRPANYSKTSFWKSDITLLKTVNPFKITTEVAVAQTSPFRFSQRECVALMYVKPTPTTSEDKVLLQFSVILQKSNSKSCGNHFHEPTMICATDSELMESIKYCEGNSGGPLVCDNTVAGLQTYIKDDCRPPHKYQLLSKWDTFIKCGIEDQCGEKLCTNICKVTNKDFKREAKPEAESSEEEESDNNKKSSEQVHMRASDNPEASTEVTDSGTSTTVTSDSYESTTTVSTEGAESNEEGESTTLTKVIEEEIAPQQIATTTSMEPQVEVTTSTTTEDAIMKVARKSWFQDYKYKEPVRTTTSKPPASPSPSLRLTTSMTAPKANTVKAVITQKPQYRSRQVKPKSSASKMRIISELVIVVSILLCVV